MFTRITRSLRVVPAAIVGLGLLFSPVAAIAQSNNIPSYAVARDQTIHGTISNFNGAYTMYVRDKRGYVDNVQLHQGTIINPTGIQLQPGYPVTVAGRVNGNTFVADEIDTPFHYTPAPVTYEYRAYPWYPAPVVGLGWGFHRWWGWR